MMDPRLSSAHVMGYERVAAWSDLLDRINVFPVADADTGRNLKVSLAPIRALDGSPVPVIRRLTRAATGNSGNIAAAFFSHFLAADTPAGLLAAAREGRDHAWQVMRDPRPGTMLSLLDALVSALSQRRPPSPELSSGSPLIDELALAVQKTTDQLPALARAGVVDAGALGLFIYLEGFWGQLTGAEASMTDPSDRFSGRLRIAPAFQPAAEEGFCIDALIAPAGDAAAVIDVISAHGESIVADTLDRQVKLHLHSRDRAEARRLLESVGTVLHWQDSALAHDTARRPPAAGGRVHVVTDAAGSLTRADADRFGITLLDSYLLVDDQVVPETHFKPEVLYSAMRAGRPVSTAQASVFERHECYRSVLSRHRHVIYLAVGSAFTGNADTAAAWQAQNDPDGRLTVVDTGAASGRLALIALATAREALRADDPDAVYRYAVSAAARCEEYVFLDQLKYLARGGRISKSKGFVGDLLNMKPIISPRPSGAEKIGVVRNRQQQVAFAVSGLKDCLGPAAAPLILLQYSDNRDWVTKTAAPSIAGCYPDAEILLRPLSLTSGAHMGPGTWAVAFLPDAPPASEDA
ncbi:MAG: DegV family protein [Pseudomonadota bacterium]